ncbi:MAG: P-loop NTPase [Thermoanaerobaculaceae bacterium]|nr:P-loop NTPase [Thermoanaerobaculaceae bacterium]MDI9620446.1 P-loop NTPase [Acidobacteriota bacterium]NLH12760.1 MinD/ParA family protein [Holophagae bacterium]
MMLRRVVTVASGKGGVGKSTFAVNYALALSRVAPTVLVDLDTGTSSVRNTIDAPVQRDLYHFLRRGEPLERCLTTLPGRLDPRGLFSNFAFVAAPQHTMEELINFSDERRDRLIRAINTLPATFAVVDLRAGLDAQVLDFLPHSNSGILVFTPHHPAATMAAAEIVKALLFRKLRLLFAHDGPLAARAVGRQQLGTINALLDRVEDSYDDGIPNLDAFLADLFHAFGDTEVVRALAANVASFCVHFVLNLFDGVHETFDGAVAPFVRSLQRHVSAHLSLHNLGWIVTSPEIHRSNQERRPIVLQTPTGPEGEIDPIQKQLDALAKQVGIEVFKRPQPKPIKDFLLSIDPDRALYDQLEVLNAMHRDKASVQVRDNFAYIVRRAVHLLNSLPPDQFGQRRLLTPDELLPALLESIGSSTPAPAAVAAAAPPP